nr:site-specific integrase [Magnetospirillum sulfuroxidans]
MYMGCRLEEIGQLLVGDVKVLNGTSHFAITTLVDDDEEIVKNIKTESSLRSVPLHPVLEQLGFSAYVERVRQAGHKRLFPDITSKRRKVTSAYSTWFSRFKRDAGITSHRKVFHSFRHTFKDACRAAGIPVDVHDALTGHARSSVGDGYGLGYPLERLAGEIGKVRYGLVWEKAPASAQALHSQAGG